MPYSHAFENCSGDLQIPVLEGAAVEGVATLLCRLTSKYLSESEPQYASAIDSFVGTSLVVAGEKFELEMLILVGNWW